MSTSTRASGLVTDRFERTLAWAGVAAGLLYAVKFPVAAMPDSGNGDALTFVHDHRVQNGVVFLATALAAILVALFSTGLRSRLRSGEGAESSYSSIAYGGGLLLASAMLLRSWTTLAALDATSNHNASSVRTITVLSADLWLPWIAATCVLLLGVGLGGLRSAVLPRWLSWASLVLALLCLLVPAGILVDLVMPLRLVVTGLTLRRRSTALRLTTGESVVPV